MNPGSNLISYKQTNAAPKLKIRVDYLWKFFPTNFLKASTLKLRHDAALVASGINIPAIMISQVSSGGYG
jgi:hypothetical protein